MICGIGKGNPNLCVASSRSSFAPPCSDISFLSDCSSYTTTSTNILSPTTSTDATISSSTTSFTSSDFSSTSNSNLLSNQTITIIAGSGGAAAIILGASAFLLSINKRKRLSSLSQKHWKFLNRRHHQNDRISELGLKRPDSISSLSEQMCPLSPISSPDGGKTLMNTVTSHTSGFSLPGHLFLEEKEIVILNDLTEGGGGTIKLGQLMTRPYPMHAASDGIVVVKELKREYDFPVLSFFFKKNMDS